MVTAPFSTWDAVDCSGIESIAFHNGPPWNDGYRPDVIHGGLLKICIMHPLIVKIVLKYTFVISRIFTTQNT